MTIFSFFFFVFPISILSWISDNISSQSSRRSLSTSSNNSIRSLAHSISNVVINWSVLDDIQSFRTGSSFRLQLSNQIFIDSSSSFIGSVFLIQISLVLGSVVFSRLNVLSGSLDLFISSGQFILGLLELSGISNDVRSGGGKIRLEISLGLLFSLDFLLLRSLEIAFDLSQ